VQNYLADYILLIRIFWRLEEKLLDAPHEEIHPITINPESAIVRLHAYIEMNMQGACNIDQWKRTT
jgi:hypothetical protein